MRHITKGKEPESLTRYRATAFASYEDYDDKDGLRECLLRDQGYLCCYCMRRIWAHRMRIEHWASREENPHLQLSYRNLLAACRGGERTREERLEESARDRAQERRPPPPGPAKRPAHPYHHCDKHKGNRALTVNPADPSKDCEQAIRYLADGEITSDDEAIRRDLHETLNLNLEWLKRNRKIVADVTVEYLRRKHPKGEWTPQLLQREIQERSTPRRRPEERDPGAIPPKEEAAEEVMVLEEYCQVAVFWLKKRLKRTK
jgi:hypothetical protein